MSVPPDHHTRRFPTAVDDALRTAGWQPGRWDMRQAEQWADTLRGHTTPAGHQHAVLPTAVEVWAEFGALTVQPAGPARHIAPAAVHVDPLPGLHYTRTLSDLGRALNAAVCALGTETDGNTLLAIDNHSRVYGLDHTGDWYLGPDFDTALTALLTGARPQRLTPHDTPHSPEPVDGAAADEAPHHAG